MISPATLPALLQLSSAGLPVGAFSHSLGLEIAVENGVVADADSALRWIGDYLALVWATGEVPLWHAQYLAWGTLDRAALEGGNDTLLAQRESFELLNETVQTGRSLVQWLLALPELHTLTPAHRELLDLLQPTAFATAHACAAQVLDLDPRTGLYALAWSLLENLVTAAVKLVPLGQVAGQGILRRLSSQLPAWIEASLLRLPEHATNFAPMLGMLSAQHETQYTRLFRS
jgi:urease accessory protein